MLHYYNTEVMSIPDHTCKGETMIRVFYYNPTGEKKFPFYTELDGTFTDMENVYRTINQMAVYQGRARWKIKKEDGSVETIDFNEPDYKELYPS